jgi:FHA domain-containing protein
VTPLALEVVAGPAVGNRLALDETLVVGREADGEGDLGGDPELSRRHARVSALDGEHLLVEDLGSTNGTLVNGSRISEATVVQAGDAVTLGSSTLRVATAEPPVTSTLRTDSAPSDQAASAQPAADLAMGGTHAVPTALLRVLVARAPVPREWIVRAALSILPMILALNLIIRTAAQEYFGISVHLTVMHLHTIIIISVLQVTGNSLGFYGNFGRPAGHSPLRWLAVGLGVVVVLLTLALSTLPSAASVGDYLVTVLIVIVGPSIVYPIMLGLRLRAQLAAGQRFRVHEL